LNLFTLVILWRNRQSGMQKDLTWTDIMEWMEGINQTASHSIIQQVLIMPQGVDPFRITNKTFAHLPGCNMFHKPGQPCAFTQEVEAIAA